jgi:predicted nucleic acid-binding protein
MTGETKRQFLDSNILVYAYDVTAGSKHAQAQELVSRLWHDRNGCLSIQVLQELYVNLTGKVPKRIPVEDAVNIVTDFSKWRVHVPEPPDVLAAIARHQRNRISFWDAMIIQSATRLGCAVVWSEDLNSGQAFGETRVENPFSGRLS